jgi:hypothetical protein
MANVVARHLGEAPAGQAALAEDPIRREIIKAFNWNETKNDWPGTLRLDAGGGRAAPLAQHGFHRALQQRLLLELVLDRGPVFEPHDLLESFHIDAVLC